MTRFFPSLLISVIIIQSLFLIKILSCSCSSSSSWCPHHQHRKFEQKTTIFWEFEEESNTWVPVKLPYHLLSCVNDKNKCTKVGVIEPINERNNDETRIELDRKQDLDKDDDDDDGEKKMMMKKDERKIGVLASRKRISLIKMSDDSIWVTGESGSIYERFWNGMQWVIAPHELPVQAGYAVSIFLVNRTVFALSETGILYQIQLNEHSQPVWVEFTPILDSSTTMKIKSGVTSQDKERIYFCTKNGLLLELSEADPPRWVNHGKPPGADVAAIVDVASIRPQVIFTISSSGDLYEFDRASKPMWKMHIWSKEITQDTALTPSIGCTVHRRTGSHSDSLFLLTKGGNLVERRLHQRKWKWVIHGSPRDEHLTSMTLVTMDDLTYTHPFSLFLTTASGFVFEYNISKPQGNAPLKHVEELWVNHMHPPHTKVAKGVAGLQLQVGRLLFHLDDGRLGELHQSKTGGDGVGPNPPVNSRRRSATKFTWSIIESPESEGWNAEYCTEDRGPLNCFLGVKDELNDEQTTRSVPRRRAGNKAHEHYNLVSPSSSSNRSQEETYTDPENYRNFRLRLMHEGRSFFLVTESGLIYEYLNVENVWLWVQHEHPMAMKGALGSYNSSLFLVDENNNLIIRERAGNELAWINRTGAKKGRQVIGGRPWDLPPGEYPKVTPADSLFFVSKTGGLLQLTVALRKFKWKDCRNPSDSKIAGIVDQELFRENIVFVVGRDGQLYQYNKVTGLWHRHHQSQHMVLSSHPGTAMRPSSRSLTGSLFMISEDGRLIEYHWNPMDGWNWVEHGTPSLGVTLVGSTGPCVGGNQLFLIGSNGNVYLRYLDQVTWKWSDYGFPYMGNIVGENCQKEKMCMDHELQHKTHQEYKKEAHNCDPKVAPTRPIPFTETAVIFELRDGRLAEMQRTEDLRWVWLRTIGTPTSRCNLIYRTAVAS